MIDHPLETLDMSMALIVSQHSDPNVEITVKRAEGDEVDRDILLIRLLKHEEVIRVMTFVHMGAVYTTYRRIRVEEGEALPPLSPTCSCYVIEPTEWADFIVTKAICW
jgi:hypothetical protein